EPVARAFDAGAELLLTPHIVQPRRASWEPSDLRLLRDGVYNLGFCGLKDSVATRDLVAWWADHLDRDCRVAGDEGIFVDQKWMELAPCFVERTAILRDPGLNVAYWNLPERPVDRQNGRLSVGAAPLRFVHFSGALAQDPPL